MRTVLHLLSSPDRELADTLAAGQTSLPDTRVEVVDLNASDVDFGSVVEKIFASDSVEVW